MTAGVGPPVPTGLVPLGQRFVGRRARVEGLVVASGLALSGEMS